MESEENSHNLLVKIKFIGLFKYKWHPYAIATAHLKIEKNQASTTGYWYTIKASTRRRHYRYSSQW